VKSAVALGVLLAEGIGDTIRVSLTGPPHREIDVAYDILASLGLRECEYDVAGLVAQVEEAVRGAPPSLRIAVMGCIVNGPGEAKDADIGVVGGKTEGYLFRGGEMIRTVPADRLADALAEEIDKLVREP